MRNARRALVLIAAIAIAACSDTAGPERVTVDMVAGMYAADEDFGVIRFTTDDGTVTDWVDEGATLSLRLNADGTTSGSLFAPGADEDGSDFEADLTGSWQLIGDVVTLEHEADTFLRDMDLIVVEDLLVGTETFGDTRVNLTLRRRDL